VTRRRTPTRRTPQGDGPRDRLLAQLHDGVAALTTSERWTAWLRMQARFHRYSFHNTLLIALQRPDATRVASYRTWHSLGRQVRRGERGIAIFVPITRRVEVDSDDDAPAESVRIVHAFRVGYVFDIAQTDGAPLPAITGRLGGAGVDEAVARLDAAATVLGFRVDVVPMPSGVDGECSHRAGVMRIDSALAAADRVVTEAHELAHAVLHPTGYAGTPRPQAELEAESVAYIICQHLGLDSARASFGYVAHWGGGENASAAITASATAIRRGAAAILDALGAGVDVQQAA
jgi:antirestriction protein ArdC